MPKRKPIGGTDQLPPFPAHPQSQLSRPHTSPSPSPSIKHSSADAEQCKRLKIILGHQFQNSSRPCPPPSSIICLGTTVFISLSDTGPALLYRTVCFSAGHYQVGKVYLYGQERSECPTTDRWWEGVVGRRPNHSSQVEGRGGGGRGTTNRHLSLSRSSTTSTDSHLSAWILIYMFASYFPGPDRAKGRRPQFQPLLKFPTDGRGPKTPVGVALLPQIFFVAGIFCLYYKNYHSKKPNSSLLVWIHPHSHKINSYRFFIFKWYYSYKVKHSLDSVTIIRTQTWYLSHASHAVHV